LDLTENKNLKLALNGFHRNKFSRVKVTGAGVIDQNVEVTSFSERGTECRVDRKSISQVETDGMQSGQFWNAFQIARCTPDLVTLRHQ